MTWHKGVGETEEPVYRTRLAGSSVGGHDGDLRWSLDVEDSILTVIEVAWLPTFKLLRNIAIIVQQMVTLQNIFYYLSN